MSRYNLINSMLLDLFLPKNFGLIVVDLDYGAVHLEFLAKQFSVAQRTDF